MTVFLTLVTVSLVRAGNEQFTFFTKAKSYFEKEKVLSTDKVLVTSSIDSILSLNENDINFQIAYSTSWEIGLFLLQQGKHPKALDIFNDLRYYLDAKKPVTDDVLKQRSSVYNIIGAIYEETGLWNEALDLYMNSLQICNENNNNSGKAKVYNNIGKLYFNRNELTKAEDLFLKAIEINKTLGIRQELFNNYNNLAGIYKSRNDFKQALEYALIALNQLDIKEDAYNLAILYPNIGALYQDMGNYTIALSYYEQAAEIAESRSFAIALIESYRSIASVYSDMNENEQAAKYLTKSLKLAEKLGNASLELTVLRSAATFYGKTGDFRLSAKFHSRYVNLNDSLEALNSLTKIEQIQAVYKVINTEKDNKILQQKINLQLLALQRQRILLVTGLLLFLSLAYFLFNLQRNRKNERARNEYMAYQTIQLHQKEKEMMLTKERNLELELDYKNRQLTSYALHMAKNNEFISRTSEGLKQIFIGLPIKDKEKSQQVRNLLSQLHPYSSGNDWEEFRLYFQEVHQSFDKNLSTAFPDLSPNDKKICALLKLGLSTKDIASITFREIRSVESARNRLRKKLGIGFDINIVNFLSQF